VRSTAKDQNVTTRKLIPVAAASITFLFLQSTGAAQSAARAKPAVATTQTGVAIFYSDALHGKPLASGEKYDKNALTAAHRTLPLGTMVKVTNLKNNKSVVLRINDRGPHGAKTLILDVSGRAAQELEMIRDGRVRVRLEVVQSPGN
jgi:rare lipoprotein A